MSVELIYVAIPLGQGQVFNTRVVGQPDSAQASKSLWVRDRFLICVNRQC